MYKLRERYERALAEVTKEDKANLVKKDSQLLRAYVTAHLVAPDDDFESRYKAFCLEGKYAWVAYKDFRFPLSVEADFVTLSIMSFSDFLRYVVPDLTLNLSEFLRYCEEKNWDIWVMAHHLIILNKLSFDMLEAKGKNAEAGKELSKTVIARVYAQYQKLDCSDNRLNFGDFQNLYRAILLSPLDRKEVAFSPAGKGSATELIRIFSEETDWRRMQLYQLAADFIVEGMTPNEILETNPPSVFAKNKDWNERRKVIETVQKLMLKLKPLDVLGAVFLYRRHRLFGAKAVAAGDDFFIINNDIPLENGLIFSSFLSALDPNQEEKNNVFVFFPSPFFVRKWSVAEGTCSRKVTFIVASEEERKLYKWHFEHVAYSSVEHKNIRFLSKEQWLSMEKKTEDFPDYALVFSSRLAIEEKHTLLQALKMSPIPIEVYDLFGTHEVETLDSPLLDSLFDAAFSIKDMLLIPQGINNCTRPRRKIFAHYQINGIVRSENIRLSAMTLNTDFGVQALSRLRVQPVEIAPETLAEAKNSVRKLFRDELWERRAAGRKNEGAISYEFTPDITIWWSRTYPKDNRGRPRIEAYFCEETPEGKTERGFRDRGKAIPTTMKHTTKEKKENIGVWLEQEYPFSYVITRNSTQARSAFEGDSLPVRMMISVRDEIIKNCLDRFAGMDIALKTLWYIYPDLRDGFSGKDYKLFQEMVRGTDIGHVRVTSGTVQELQEKLLRNYPDAPREQLMLQLRILYTALEFARKKEYCQSNFLSKTMLDEQKYEKLFAQVRQALVKRSLTAKEFQDAYDKVRQKIYVEDRLEYVGVMIRLLLGLESNIVCALTWGDLVKIEDYDIWKISVCRQVTNNGEQVCGFEDIEDYRSLPCMDALLECLCYVRERQMKRLPEFAHCVDSLHMVLLPNAEEPGKIVPPYKLDKLSKEVLGLAAISDDIVHIPVGESGAGTKETNLNKYYGNFFRSNIDYWLREELGFSVDEKQYFLGNKPATTFGTYYCDFLADHSQLIMYGKLQRLGALLAMREPQTARCTVLQGTSQETLELCGEKDPISVMCIVEAGGKDGRLRASIQTRFGATIQAFYLDEDTEKGGV